MGLFDELSCEYPLPDGFDPQDILFQTQDTPAQWLEHYTLTSAGRLRVDTTGELLPYHGALAFYASNICGASPTGVITRDDEAPWWAEYIALFDHGVLLKLEGQKVLDTSHRHLTRKEFFAREAQHAHSC